MDRRDKQAVVLYLGVHPDSRIQEMKLAGIRRFAAARNWRVVGVSAEQSRAAAVPALLRLHRPLGVIVECSDGRADLSPRIFRGLPVVYVDRAPASAGRHVANVVDDGEAAARAAFRELVSTRPLAYAVVGYREPHPWSSLRIHAFGNLVREAGGVCRVFRRTDLSAAARGRQLAAWMARLPDRTAIFAVNDATALEVLAACRQAGRRICSDMTLVGVDNVANLCEAAEPPLSSVQLDAEKAGFRAARLLDRLRSGEEGPLCEVYGPQMTVRRESTRGTGRRGPDIQTAVELIRHEACAGLTAAEVARTFSGSRRLFEMRFREAMGHSVLDEIQNVRLEQVFLLLEDTRTPIGAIAGRCGYRSERALRKTFLLRTGKSLQDWRRQNCILFRKSAT